MHFLKYYKPYKVLFAMDMICGLVVESGKIVERGTHEELLTQVGTYARYNNLQFGGHA